MITTPFLLSTIFKWTINTSISLETVRRCTIVLAYSLDVNRWLIKDSPDLAKGQIVTKFDIGLEMFTRGFRT